MVSVSNTPALRWQVWVDWAGAGVWGADDVDISDDVLGLRWRAGRRGLPAPEFAPPATLELTLRNLDHRYTPSNAGGPLGQNVQPGREIRLRAGWLGDDFVTNRAAPVDLHGRVAPHGAVRWEVAGTAGGFSLRDGAAYGVIGRGRPSDAVALLDTGDPLATLTVGYRRVSNGLGGFALRCAARNDCLRLRFTSAATRLERVSGRAVTLLATGDALDASVWYDLEIEQPDGGVRVYATNQQAAGVVRKEILAAGSIAGAPASGRHGLWRGFRNTVDRWGDFGVGRSLFSGRITAIRPDYAAGKCWITAADALRRLESVRLYRALSGGPMRAGDVAAAILGWAGLAPADYALDSGRMLLTGGPRSVWDVPASRALRRVQQEEHGLIYADGLGRIRLEAASVRAAVRSHNAPTTLARFSIADNSDSAGPYAAALRWNDGAASVAKRAIFSYRRPADNGRQPVWSLAEPLAVAAQDEARILATADGWDVIQDVATPVANTDYQATNNADGTGADATGWITVAPLAEAQSGVSGRGIMLRVRNSGTQTAYLHRLRLYAAHSWELGDAATHRAAAPDTGDDAPAGVVRCRYADNYAAAQGAAESRLAERSRQRPQLAVTLPLSAAANGRAAAEGRVSDVVEVQAAAQGIAGAWLLEGMEVSAGAGGAGQTRWWLTGV